MPAGPDTRRRALAPGVLAALGAGGIALFLAIRAGVAGPGAADDVARVVLAAVVPWALCGYAPARLLTPPVLRPHWLLLVVPAGAMLSALEFTLLGFAAVPFGISLVVVLLAGAVSAVWAHRRPVPSAEAVAAARDAAGVGDAGCRWARLAWPAWIVLLCLAIVLLPIFRTGTSTIVGTSGDAHLAAGTAEYLKHGYPTSSDPALPLDQVPLAWRSKVPIYYSFAAVSELSGRDTVATFMPLAALVLALSVLGFHLCALYLLRAPVPLALLGTGLLALNGMTFFTATHPYFNQTWGLFAMPFVLVLGWAALRERTIGTAALTLLFAAVGAFAYPLMLAFPVGFFAAWLVARGANRPRDLGATLRDLVRRRRLYPLYLLVAAGLAIPAYGIFEKVVSGVAVVVGDRSLEAWSGDLREYIPVSEFVSFVSFGGVWAGVLVAAVAAGAMAGLLRASRPVALSLLTVFAAAALAALLFRERDFGWYFYFKVLAYLGPLLVIAAAAGLGRLASLGRAGTGLAVALAAGWLAAGTAAVDDRVSNTYPQVTPDLIQLRDWDRELPPEASVRIDLDPEAHQWISYMLSGHRVESRDPLTWAGYPHVPFGRKADYVIADPRVLRPNDATGRPVLRNDSFVLYRMDPSVPGMDRASRRMVQTIRSVPLI